MSTVVSWSGGKDSCLALYKALESGEEVSHLLNFVRDDAAATMSHCLPPGLIEAQAEALGLPLVQKRVSWDTYETGFKEALRELKTDGVDKLVNGDIDLPEGIVWNQKMCRELDIRLAMPLENIDPERMLLEFITVGFKAIIVCVNTGTPARDWLGVEIGPDFLKRLHRQDAGTVHFCGELGEYHTLVTDGPIFRQKIEIIKANPVAIEGYSYLDISRYEVKRKDTNHDNAA